ncbi:hypothetical protein [uncultured Paludibaculum sp.]|uniref:hypothetical protein n=1 Tax=uncultured Paludibaculum sp. TaxID=1765020 RepID=UPI002AAAA64E|nr:hypothetical protein [uncultured Paludibaculum sp.]
MIRSLGVGGNFTDSAAFRVTASDCIARLVAGFLRSSRVVDSRMDRKRETKVSYG